MYLEHFGLTQFPFSIAPDPDFLYPTLGHQEALAHLHYAFTGLSGLICLTGEVGTGKTTVCRAFMDAAPAHVRIAYLFNPQLSAQELLQSICDELELAYPPNASLKVMYAVLNNALLELYAQGKKVICLIDEAQAMPAPLLEQVRLLTNLETHKEKLLTLILVGQPELNELLDRHDMRQLRQRISARFHLHHLNRDEARHYIHHRCAFAGAEQPLFSDKAIDMIWRASQGVPRLMNSMADRALLGCYAQGDVCVNDAVARQACTEVQPAPSIRRPAKSFLKRRFASASLLFLLLAGIGLVAVFGTQRLFSPASLEGLLSETKTPMSPVAALANHLGLSAEQCAQLPIDGWQCLWIDWSVSELKRLKQAVMLQVQSREHETAEPYWLALADYSAQPTTQRPQYTGQALLLWQPPSGYGTLVKPGMSSPVIPWVRAQLGMSWGENWQVIAPTGRANKANTGNEFYDPLLARAVADFQRREGLTPDRILGPKTLLMLQSVSASSDAQTPVPSEGEG